jgi:hypothetical protein
MRPIGEGSLALWTCSPLLKGYCGAVGVWVDDPDSPSQIYQYTMLERTMTNTLTPEDIRDLLTGFAAAIELDQLRFDAIPSEKFHPEYSDGRTTAEAG